MGVPTYALVGALILTSIGCIGAEAPPQEGATLENGAVPVEPACEACTAVPNVTEALARAPTWEVGDWWEYRESGTDGDGTTRLVVAERGGDTYQLLSPDEDLMSYDAAFDVSFVGPIRAADLAGRQGDTPVQFFQFPLKEGATWTTTWDGEEVTITVAADPSPKASLGKLGALKLVATNATGVEKARYGYSPEVRWVTWMEFLDGDGTVAFGTTLSQMGKGFNGTVFRGEARGVTSVSSDVGHGGARGQFTMAPEDSSIFILYGYGGAVVAHTGSLVNPKNERIEVDRNAGVQTGAGNLLFVPGIPGQWTYDFEFVGPPALSGYALLVKVLRLAPVTL